MLNPDLSASPIPQDNFDFLGPQKRKEDIARQFCAFAKAQILANKKPTLVRDILEALHTTDPIFYEQIKQKCEDYPRIVLSQSKYATFTKYRSALPKQGVHKRTIYYGLDSEPYDPSEWIPFEKTPTNQYDLPNIPSALTILPKFPNNIEDNLPASKEWRSLIETISLTDPFWIHLLDAISKIDHEVISGRGTPNLVKNIIAGDPVLSDPTRVVIIEKILNNENEYRHQLFSK